MNETRVDAGVSPDPFAKWSARTLNATPTTPCPMNFQRGLRPRLRWREILM